jgi:hypothetical protein
MPISALITGSGGGFLFEQDPFSPYHIEDIEWEKGIPGGDLSATIHTAFVGPFYLPSINSLVVLSDLVGPWWLGIFDAADVEYWTDPAGLRGAKVVLHCVGWGAIADDQVYLTRQVFPVGTTAGDMFRHARDHLCPGMSSTNAFIAATAEVALEEESKNFRGDNALAVWNAATAMGSTHADADPLIWKVRGPMGAAGPQTTPILEVYAVPDAPSYTIDLEDGYLINTKIERAQLRNHIIVNYGTGSGDPLHEVAAINPLAEAFSIQGWAEANYRLRQMWVDASSEFRAAAFMAQRVADCNLAKYGVVHGSGFTVSIPFDGTGAHPIVVDPGPTTIPIWRMEAGYNLNVDNDQTWAGLPNNPARLITRIHGSLKSGQIQVTTGILGDSRQAQRMTGAVTLRQLLDLPSLSRPNRPEEWQRSTIEFIMDSQEDPGFLIAQYPHILRYINIFAVPLVAESGGFESVEVVIGVGTQEAFPSYDELVSATVSTSGQQIMSADRRVEPGSIYTFYFRNAVPTGVRVLATLAVDRIKVVE